MSNWLWIGSSTLLCLQWITIHLSGIHPPPELQALSAGLAIFGAAFLLSWAAELAQLEIPQSLAIALLALIAVLPEYAVDMYFAWVAGKDPKYTAFAMANMTGANRLLIGVGWAAVVITVWLKSGRRGIALEPEHKIEIFYLGLATIYSFIIPFKGRLDLMDAAVLVTIFAFYMRAAAKASHVEPELEGPAEMVESWGQGPRRFFTVAFFSTRDSLSSSPPSLLPKDFWPPVARLGLKSSSWSSGSRPWHPSRRSSLSRSYSRCACSRE